MIQALNQESNSKDKQKKFPQKPLKSRLQSPLYIYKLFLHSMPPVEPPRNTNGLADRCFKAKFKIGVCG